MKVIRFFECGLTGVECVIVWNGEEEICVTKNDYLENLVK